MSLPWQGAAGVCRCKISDVCCHQRPRLSGRSLGFSDLNNIDQAERDKTDVEYVATYYAETIVIMIIFLIKLHVIIAINVNIVIYLD